MVRHRPRPLTLRRNPPRRRRSTSRQSMVGHADDVARWARRFGGPRVGRRGHRPRGVPRRSAAFHEWRGDAHDHDLALRDHVPGRSRSARVVAPMADGRRRVASRMGAAAISPSWPSTSQTHSTCSSGAKRPQRCTAFSTASARSTAPVIVLFELEGLSGEGDLGAHGDLARRTCGCGCTALGRRC